MADPPPVLTLWVEKGRRSNGKKSMQLRAGDAALRVGRGGKGNGLALEGDAGVSERHLSVQFFPPPAARWVVTDLGSSNGTVLNGKPLVPTVPAPLSHGDLIKIGEITLLAVSISGDAARRAACNAEAAGQGRHRTGRRNAGAAAEAPETGNEDGQRKAVVAMATGSRRGEGRGMRASARNGMGVTPEVDDGVAPAGRGRGRRGRGGRGQGRAMTAGTTSKAEDAIVENEQEAMDMADGIARALRVLATNDDTGSDEEHKLATKEDKVDGTSEASMELDEEMEIVTSTERAVEGRLNAQHPGSKLDGVGEVEKNDKREAVGASGEKGHVGEPKTRRRLEDMTLGEWFVQIEKFLLLKNKQAAEKAIAQVQEKHWRFVEHVKSLMLNKDPAPLRFHG